MELRVRDLAASRRLYEAALSALGMTVLYDKPGGVAFGFAGADDFGLRQAEVPSGGAHVAFAAPNRAAVDAFYAAALANGACDNGPPGLRPQYHAGYYGAFVVDLDGNNIEAVFHDRSLQSGD
jgi:catechol 2,3-dioxygenase-like lactoylglutathione lyase family enzyme